MGLDGSKPEKVSRPLSLSAGLPGAFVLVWQARRIVSDYAVTQEEARRGSQSLDDARLWPLKRQSQRGLPVG
jgi:hypothetical protein